MTWYNIILCIIDTYCKYVTFTIDLHCTVSFTRMHGIGVLYTYNIIILYIFILVHYLYIYLCIRTCMHIIGVNSIKNEAHCNINIILYSVHSICTRRYA